MIIKTTKQFSQKQQVIHSFLLLFNIKINETDGLYIKTYSNARI